MATTIRQALKGRGDFISDIYTRDMLYAATIRSPYPRALIRRVHCSELPDGVVCVTAADIPGRNAVAVDDESMPLLAHGESAYVGEPVAIVAGASQRDVVRAIAMIDVEYEELEPVLEFAHQAESQVIARLSGQRGDVENALQRSASRVEGSYRTGIQEHLYNEPQGAVVSIEEGIYLVRSATQWPFHVRSTVADALGVAAKLVVVRPADPGIALDGKLWYPSVVAAHAALLARAAGRPVKLVYSNIEDFRFSPKRAPFHIAYTSGLTADGRLSGVDIDVRYNAGAYGVFTREICERVIASSLGLYACDDLRVTVTAVRTNLPPLNVLSGFGVAASAFAGETHVNRLAEVAQVDPLGWRRAHGLATTNGAKPRSGSDQARASRVLAAAAHGSDFERKFAAYELQKKRRHQFDDLRRPTQGIGIALSLHGGGFVGDHEPRHGGTIVVRLESDGSAVLRTSAVPGSRSVLTSWRSRMASILGLEAVEVRIENADTSQAPDSGPSTLSRNVVIISRLVEQACNAIQRKRFRSPLPIEVRRSYRVGRGGSYDVAKLEGTPFPHSSFAAAVVEVSVDPVTFESTVRNVWLTVDAGRILDEAEAKRSLEMSVYQALEWATHEVIEYRRGAIDPRSYLAYRNVGDPVLPQISIALLGSPERGPEGIGELPQNCIPAALAAAVSQATGRYMDRIPTNPSLIHDYLDSGRTGERESNGPDDEATEADEAPDAT